MPSVTCPGDLWTPGLGNSVSHAGHLWEAWEHTVAVFDPSITHHHHSELDSFLLPITSHKRGESAPRSTQASDVPGYVHREGMTGELLGRPAVKPCGRQKGKEEVVILLANVFDQLCVHMRAQSLQLCTALCGGVPAARTGEQDHGGGRVGTPPTLFWF